MRSIDRPLPSAGVHAVHVHWTDPATGRPNELRVGNAHVHANGYDRLGARLQADELASPSAPWHEQPIHPRTPSALTPQLDARLDDLDRAVGLLHRDSDPTTFTARTLRVPAPSLHNLDDAVRVTVLSERGGVYEYRAAARSVPAGIADVVRAASAIARLF